MDKITLLRRLLDNEFHSGFELSVRLGVRFPIISEQIKQLRAYGLEIVARHGRGYRLGYRLIDEIELLERDAILDELGQSARGCTMELLFDTESTNKCLTDLFGQPELHKRIVLAEYQNGGRGRRGRSWVSPFARGLYLSLAWRFDVAPTSLNALSLAVGVALARTLAELGMHGLSLKWPNDLILDDKKVGGILLEARSETAASCDVVIGIGLNVRLDKETKSALDQPVTDLDEHYSCLPSRNRLAGRVISGQLSMLERVAAGKMGEYVAEWRNLDYLSGRQAELHMPGQVVRGQVKGVDDNGLLLLETCGSIRKFSSGELQATRLSDQVMS